MRVLVAVLLLVLGVPAVGEAVELHVAPGGDDGAGGAVDQPLGSLAGARDTLRKKFPDGVTENVTVIVHGGTYRISEPITFTPRDGGAENVTVTYRAADGANKPIISGGRPITGWRDNGDGTWSATIPAFKAGDFRFRELFVADERRPRAAHPNDGFVRIVKSGADKRTFFTFKPGDIPAGLDAGRIELLFLHDWSTSRVAVKDIDHDNHVLTVADPIGCSAAHYRIDHFEPHPRYRLENDPAFLDAPGEWYLDEDAGVLTYKPREGETLAQFKASPPIAPLATSLLEVRGTDARPVRNLHFVGLHFAHCAWHTPKGGYAAGQACFHETRDGGQGGPLREITPAAVTFERAENCRFERGSVAHVGGSGIAIGSRCNDCALVDSHVHDVAGNGVLIGEDRGRAVEGRPWWQSAPQQVATGNVMRGNVIEHCGRLFYGAVGVWVGFAADTRIEGNTIRRLPYTGVSVGWMWSPTPTPCRGNRVERNHIHHVMQVLSDGGGIYTLGRQPGGVLAGNVIHDVPLNLGRAESNGMFLDEGTTELTIRDNLIYNLERSPLRFHRAQENTVTRNVLVTPTGVPIVRYNATDPKVITIRDDNQVIEAKQWQPGDADGAIRECVKELVEKAGVKGE